MIEENFNIKLLDVDKFIKVNDIKPITNPVMFNANKQPTDDGLLSNIIFGVTKETRSGVYGYINLRGRFLQPLVYKIWCKVDSNIKNIVHGIKRYTLSQGGQFVEDPEGETGLDFLEKCVKSKKIKFRSTGSIRRDNFIKFLKNNLDVMFIDKLLVIPPFYRDVKTDGGKISVGDINKLYINIIVISKALEEGNMYGFNVNDSIKGKIQEGMLEIYNWFGSGTDSNPHGGIPGKFGVMRRAGISKTTDYATRLVMSAPQLNVESMDEIRADLDHSLIPLSSAAVNFFPFVIFEMRRFFENEFISNDVYAVVNEKKERIDKYHIQDYQISFSDIVLKRELDRFINGQSDRFRQVLVPLKDNPKKGIPMAFKGYNVTYEEYLQKYKDKDLHGIMTRPLTWCDVIYLSTMEAVKNKMILITRYPIDTFYNQFTTKVRLSSTKETEPMTINGVYYPYYPKIRELGIDTSNKFVDTINISNCYLGSIGGDYDGDMVTVKGIYTDEANAELEKQLNSKIHYINLGCKSVIEISNEAIQSLFALTITIDDTLTDPKF